MGIIFFIFAKLLGPFRDPFRSPSGTFSGYPCEPPIDVTSRTVLGAILAPDPSPKCSRAGKYHTKLNVATFAPATHSGCSLSRNRVHNGPQGELIWVTEGCQNRSMKKEAMTRHGDYRFRLGPWAWNRHIIYTRITRALTRALRFPQPLIQAFQCGA